MDVTQLPFNRFIGLEACPPESGFFVRLDADPKYTNHLGTVHAAALLAVAEAGAGAFLIRHFGDPSNLVPVVRRLEAKFRRPATGSVRARVAGSAEAVQGWAAELAARGRVSATVPVEVVDDSGAVVLTASVEWFVVRQLQNPP
jgi:acyl-coenzyme A thioesterase PaaI-like protein